VAIFGVALLALCMLIGVFAGDALGALLHVKANVGGVGIAMMLLIAARYWLTKAGKLSHGMKMGVEFWAALYIPIVVAMASIQNVTAAVSGGPMVVVAGLGTVLLCLGATALLGRWGGPAPHLSKAEREAQAHAERVLGGDPE
jgi:malonate transporter MadL subunit